MDEIVRKNKFGFFEIASKPLEKELEQYYETKYFQQLSAQYQSEYSEDELTYFANRAVICKHTIRNQVPKVTRFFEVGCGEGFFAHELSQDGVDHMVLNDLTSAGLERFNPHLLPCLKKNNIYNQIDELLESSTYFDLISMENVLEHVIDPEKLLLKLKPLMHKGSVLRLSVPNDYSEFQNLLLERGLADNTWVCPPDHLSYFNSENLVNFCKSLEFNVLSVQCDFPIELFLLNKHSHYYKDRSLGKQAHYSRVLCTNYLVNKDVDAYIRMSEAAAKLQFGRVAIIYLTL